MSVKNEIKQALKDNKLVIGSRKVLSGVKNGKITSVVVASNCPDSVRLDMNHYSSISGVPVKSFDADSLQLGEFCGKPFNILLVGIRK